MMTINYKDKIGKMLFELPMRENANKKMVGEFFIEKNVTPENRDLFVECVKSYIDKDFGLKDGFEILFSDDYSKVLKIERTTA